MKIYANDYSLENIKLEFHDEKLSLQEKNNYLIDNFFALINGWFEPYSIEIQIKSYKSLNYENYYEPTKSFYKALQVTKDGINTNIDIYKFWENTVPLTVKELDAESVKRIMNITVSENNFEEEKISLNSISCGTGLYLLPVNNLSEDLILRNNLNSEKAYPITIINNNTWIEATLKNSGTLWTPIEFTFYTDGISLKLNLDLNWDLYSKRNQEGHQFLKNIIKKMLEKGWIERN